MARFPSLFVGQRFTADLATSMLPDFYNKTGPTVRNTTVLAADPDLVAPVVANALYEVVVNLQVNGADAADIQINFTAPAGSTFVWNASAQSSASTVYGGDIAYSAVLGTTVTFGTITAGPVPVMIVGNLNTDVTAGNFSLRWACGTAVNVTVVGDSYMKLTRMA